MPFFATALALIALHSTPALGSPSPTPQPIVGGELLSATEWPSVVSLIGIKGGVNTNTAYLCTGVLIDAQTALTAAHCLDEAETFDQIMVTFGDTIYTNDDNRRTTGDDYGIHPDYCLSECTEDAYDFGYVTLSEPAMGVPIIPPLVDQDEWDELISLDHEVLFVGFGAIRDTDAKDSPGPLEMSEIGLKRAVTSVITGFSPAGLEIIAGQEGRDTCFGDSGGPVFAQLATGDWRLVGITSRGVTPCGSGRGIYGVPYAALPWIRDETGINLLPPNCSDGDCLDTLPAKKETRGCSQSGIGARNSSSGYCLSLGISLLGLGICRRRRAKLL
ncbi:MAG TPA: trypsin-like serine protease [Nannocystis exedens]|nr:trypsin-like serine protease [Nannocystis exedens]